MKKLIVLLVLLLMSCLLLATPAEAHVLATDKDISAVMHTDPDDEPFAHAPTYFFFEFKDTTNHFDPKNCNCTVDILEKGQIIFSQSLFQDNTNPSLSNASFSYIFAEENDYVVKVIGRPTQGANFQPFTLSYDLRVGREVTPSTKGSQNSLSNFLSTHTIHLGIGIAILLLVIARLVYLGLTKRKKLSDNN